MRSDKIFLMFEVTQSVLRSHDWLLSESRSNRNAEALRKVTECKSSMLLVMSRELLTAGAH